MVGGWEGCTADACKKLFLNKNELMFLKNKPCGLQVNFVFEKGVGKSTKWATAGVPRLH